ncbi:hypothetical protein M3231_18875 [Neobacillus mesonae]|nr:hypothetical protein [Neobacillus mesonae]
MRLGKKEVWFISTVLMLTIAIMMALIYIWSGDQDTMKSEQAGAADSKEVVLEPLEPEQDQAFEPSEEKSVSENPFFPDDLPFPIGKTEGYLGDQFPLHKKSVKRISILLGMDNGMRGYTVPPENYKILVSGLKSLNMTKAKTEINSSALASEVYIRFNIDGQMYSIPYNLDFNTVELNGQHFYASRNMMTYLHLFCRPNTLLAMFGEKRSIDVSTENIVDTKEDNTLRYNIERFKVDDKDFSGWRTYIGSSAEYEDSYHYYSIADDIIKTVRMNEEAGILSTDSMILFSKSNVETSDGLTIGMSEKEVMDRLGKANLSLDSKWSYTIDDNRNLHLYFVQGNVRYITLTSE